MYDKPPAVAVDETTVIVAFLGSRVIRANSPK